MITAQSDNKHQNNFPRLLEGLASTVTWKFTMKNLKIWCSHAKHSGLHCFICIMGHFHSMLLANQLKVNKKLVEMYLHWINYLAVKASNQIRLHTHNSCLANKQVWDSDSVARIVTDFMLWTCQLLCCFWSALLFTNSKTAIESPSLRLWIQWKIFWYWMLFSHL